jgi:hypothetical protein
MEIKDLVDRFNGEDTSEQSLSPEQEALYAETVAAAQTLFDQAFADTIESPNPNAVVYSGEHLGMHLVLGEMQSVYVQASKLGVEHEGGVATDSPVMTYRLYVALPDVCVSDWENYDPTCDILDSSNSTDLGIFDLSTCWMPSMKTLRSVIDFGELLHDIVTRRITGPQV